MKIKKLNKEKCKSCGGYLLFAYTNREFQGFCGDFITKYLYSNQELLRRKRIGGRIVYTVNSRYDKINGNMNYFIQYCPLCNRKIPRKYGNINVRKLILNYIDSNENVDVIKPLSYRFRIK